MNGKFSFKDGRFKGWGKTVNGMELCVFGSKKEEDGGRERSRMQKP